MSDSIEEGCGCLLLALFASLVLAIYPFYDGYFSRSLPTKELPAIRAVAFLVRDKSELDVEIRNESTWVIRSADATFRVIMKSGEITTYSLNLTHEGRTKFRLPPAVDHYFVLGASLPDEAAAMLARSDLDRWEWELGRTKGHRPPLNVIKIPVDFVRSLFSRSTS